MVTWGSAVNLESANANLDHSLMEPNAVFEWQAFFTLVSRKQIQSRFYIYQRRSQKLR
jgi:hypothetical protein